MPMFPHSSVDRKLLPITEGVLDYFPDAIAYVAFVSKIGNDKHNPGEPMHWARAKSTDHRNCIARHLIEAGTYDADGLLNEGTMAWRALAALQLRLEEMAAQGHDIWKLYGPMKLTATVSHDNISQPTKRQNVGGDGSGPAANNGGTEWPVGDRADMG